MAKTQLKILILDDDESIGTSLKELFERSGHQAVYFKKQDDFLNHVARNSVDYIFVDCFLPGVPGVQIVEKIKKEYPTRQIEVVLMSGILTDKSFVQESVNKTQALSFLKKPFELKEALDLIKHQPGEKSVVKSDFLHKIENMFKTDVDPRTRLYHIFDNAEISNREKRKLIESLDDVSGFDLPFIYSLLVETKSTGYLNIMASNGSVSGVTFCDGNIVRVDIEDKGTYLGEMLIQSGYAAPLDVQKAVQEKKNYKLGEFLIQSNLISPHAFDLILSEQMNIRLSKTIIDSKIKINFSPTETELSSPHIDSDTLIYYLHDWIASKISTSWLRAFYMPYLNNMIKKSASYNEVHPALQMSLVKSQTDLLNQIKNASKKDITLSMLLNNDGKEHEAATYKAIHFLLTKGLIVLDKNKLNQSEKSHLMQLNDIWSELDGKNSFEVVRYLENAGLYNHKEGLSDKFIDFVGAEPTGEDVKKIWLQIKNKIIESIKEISDSTQIKKLQEQSQKNEAEMKLKATSMVEEVRIALNMNQFQKASQLLEQIREMEINVEHFNLYSAWAKIAQIDPSKKLQIIKEVELEIMQIPPEQKYESIYSYILSLLNKAKGDLISAKKNLEKCIAMNPGFIPARREWNMIEAAVQQKKKENILTGDLKTVVTNFFKKKA